MTLANVVILVTIVGFLIFILGTWFGAHLARPRARGRTTEQGGGAALVELIQLLRDALAVVRDLRDNQPRKLAGTQPRRKRSRRR